MSPSVPTPHGDVGMWGGDGPVHSEEVEQLLIEGNDLPPGSGLFVGIMHMFVLDFHPFSLDLALY